MNPYVDRSFFYFIQLDAYTKVYTNTNAFNVKKTVTTGNKLDVFIQNMELR